MSNFPKLECPSDCATLSLRNAYDKLLSRFRLRSLELSAIASGRIDRDFLRASYIPGFPTLHASFRSLRCTIKAASVKVMGLLTLKPRTQITGEGEHSSLVCCPQTLAYSIQNFLEQGLVLLNIYRFTQQIVRKRLFLQMALIRYINSTKQPESTLFTSGKS